MQSRRPPFTFWKMMTVVGVAFSRCSAARGSQVEHDNVAIAVSPDGQQVAFSAADGDLYLLSLGTRRVSRLTKTDATESSPSFSADGKSLVYAATIEGRKRPSSFLAHSTAKKSGN